MTELPLWAIWIAVILIPLIAVAAGAVSTRIARRGSIEADKRGQREEEMRQMRWATDHLVSGDPRREKLGADQLAVLLQSELLTEPEKIFIETALMSAVAQSKAEIERAEANGEIVTIVQLSLEEAEALRALGQVEDFVVDVEEDEEDAG